MKNVFKFRKKRYGPAWCCNTFGACIMFYRVGFISCTFFTWSEAGTRFCSMSAWMMFFCVELVALQPTSQLASHPRSHLICRMDLRSLRFLEVLQQDVGSVLGLQQEVNVSANRQNIWNAVIFSYVDDFLRMRMKCTGNSGIPAHLHSKQNISFQIPSAWLMHVFTNRF